MNLLRVGGTIAVAAVMVAALGAADGEKYGEGVSLAESTPIATLMADPEGHLGKTVRVDGVVDAVCTNMGCWLELKDSEEGPSLRFKVDDGVIVFPITAKGKRASAQGVFEKVDPAADEAHHTEHAAGGAAADHADHAADTAPAQYRVKATGAVVY